MKRLQENKAIKVIGIVMSYMLVVCVCALLFKSDDATKSSLPEAETSTLTAALEDEIDTASGMEESMLVTALANLYGAWEIVEDFGYHGIHRDIEIEIFEVGKTIFFSREAFRYEDSIDVPYPHIVFSVTTSPEIQAYDKMMEPGKMGFTVTNVLHRYIKIYLKESGSLYSDQICVFYVLNDNEIILEGDVRRYYRAVKRLEVSGMQDYGMEGRQT